MIATLRRKVSVYAAFAAIVPKLFLAYSIWVWVELGVQVIWLTVFVYFWRAVYAEVATIGGLTLDQTLNYVLLAQVLAPLVQAGTIRRFGEMMREGGIAVELLRPIDIQARMYVEALAEIATTLVAKIPLALVAWLVFGLRLPTDPLVWGAFFTALLLGHAVLFCFDWIFSCLAFYSTEVWGLSVLREGFAIFFSGSLVPLVMMPDWLQTLTSAMPFAQALYAPVAILTGITPLADAPRTWLIQIAWLVGLALLSRLVFSRAVRVVTVQGG